MVTRSFVVLIGCSCFLLTIQTLFLNVMASKQFPDIDEFMIEDQRTHTRQNYVVQRALDEESLGDVDNIGPAYITAAIEQETSPEELPALIVDYANLIRNDIILLDNSVETRTRKRGNSKKNNQALPDLPCSCLSVFKGELNFGSDSYPQYVESLNCSTGICYPPFRCKETNYTIIVLRKKSYFEEQSPVPLPSELNNRWIARKENITTGCVCDID